MLQKTLYSRNQLKYPIILYKFNTIKLILDPYLVKFLDT